MSTLQRNGSQAFIDGGTVNFTGRARFAPLFKSADPAPVSGAVVTFEPGARSNWHTHPCGQTLIVTDGLGWTQCEGEAKVEIRPGDVITCPVGKRHWHGASPTTPMTHIAIAEADADGKVVDWMEPVTDAQYHSPLDTSR